MDCLKKKMTTYYKIKLSYNLIELIKKIKAIKIIIAINIIIIRIVIIT